MIPSAPVGTATSWSPWAALQKERSAGSSGACSSLKTTPPPRRTRWWCNGTTPAAAACRPCSSTWWTISSASPCARKGRAAPSPGPRRSSAGAGWTLCSTSLGPRVPRSASWRCGRTGWWWSPRPWPPRSIPAKRTTSRLDCIARRRSSRWGWCSTTTSWRPPPGRICSGRLRLRPRPPRKIRRRARVIPRRAMRWAACPAGGERARGGGLRPGRRGRRGAGAARNRRRAVERPRPGRLSLRLRGCALPRGREPPAKLEGARHVVRERRPHALQFPEVQVLVHRQADEPCAEQVGGRILACTGAAVAA